MKNLMSMIVILVEFLGINQLALASKLEVLNSQAITSITVDTMIVWNDNNTVSNCTIGQLFMRGKFNKITQNNIGADPSKSNVTFFYSANANVVTDNNLTGVLDLFGGSNNTVSSNTIVSDSIGILIRSGLNMPIQIGSKNNIISQNVITCKKVGVYVILDYYIKYGWDYPTGNTGIKNTVIGPLEGSGCNEYGNNIGFGQQEENTIMVANINHANKFILSQNYPNPFNPVTNINYQVQLGGNVQLVVYNTSGQVVATLVNEVHLPGNYAVNFDGANLPSGVYFYKLNNRLQVLTKKMNLVK